MGMGMGVGIALDTASHNDDGRESGAGHRRRASASGALPQMQQPQIQSHGSSASGMDLGHAGMEPSSSVMQRPLHPGFDALQTGIDRTHRTLDVSVSPTFPPSPPHSHATTQPLSMPSLRLDTQPGRGFGGALHSPTLDAHTRHGQPLTSGVVVVSPHSHSDEITVTGMDPLGRTSQTSRHSGDSGGTTRVAPVTTPSPQLLPLPSPQLMQPRSPVLRVCDFDMSIGSGDSGTGSRLF
ncbi:hypothetical protein BC831DRAFT_458524 [Entophlyctis helioformis]|nr:hypothetical protein BC831DRAFT_458524 [Entophlyctis helioformis]